MRMKLGDKVSCKREQYTYLFDTEAKSGWCIEIKPDVIGEVSGVAFGENEKIIDIAVSYELSKGIKIKLLNRNLKDFKKIK